MKIKNLFTFVILGALLTPSSLFAWGVDYNAGFTAGFGSNFLKDDAFKSDPIFDPTKWDFTNHLRDNFNYSLGFFAGAGAIYNRWIIFGLEYSLNLLTYKHLDSFTATTDTPSSGSLPRKVVNLTTNTNRQLSFMQNTFDLYYKVNLVEKYVPISLQFNAGLTLKQALSQTVNQKNIQTVTTYYLSGLIQNKTQSTMESSASGKLYSNLGMGLHTGLKANISMFFAGLDYYYLPGTDVYSDRARKNLAYAKKEQNTHYFVGTVGFLINKQIIDDWRK